MPRKIMGVRFQLIVPLIIQQVIRDILKIIATHATLTRA
jgi:hypothetical protein